MGLFLSLPFLFFYLERSMTILKALNRTHTLGLVSLGSHFGRKEVTSATGDLYSWLAYSYNTVPAWQVL